jgi:hypothetical protein
LDVFVVELFSVDVDLDTLDFVVLALALDMAVDVMSPLRLPVSAAIVVVLAISVVILPPTGVGVLSTEIKISLTVM